MCIFRIIIAGFFIVLTALPTRSQGIDTTVLVPPVSKVPLPVLPLREGDPDPYAFLLCDNVPRLLNLDEVMNSVRFPAVLNEFGLQGDVMVCVLVDQQGRYANHMILKSSHPIFRHYLEPRLPDLRFHPAILRDKPILYWVTMRFTFNHPLLTEEE